MNEFDRNILIVNENICKNIVGITDEDRGFKSQNILNNLRHLVEAIDQRVYPTWSLWIMNTMML